jgi:hypothetical protein
MKITHKTDFNLCKSLFLYTVGEALASNAGLKPLPHNNKKTAKAVFTPVVR